MRGTSPSAGSSGISSRRPRTQKQKASRGRNEPFRRPTRGTPKIASDPRLGAERCGMSLTPVQPRFSGRQPAFFASRGHALARARTRERQVHRPQLLQPDEAPRPPSRTVRGPAFMQCLAPRARAILTTLARGVHGVRSLVLVRPGPTWPNRFFLRQDRPGRISPPERPVSSFAVLDLL
jgi:hypothetical protein